MSLETIRNASRSIIFKIFIAFIILSFAIWGLTDIFKANPNAIASVSGESITQSEFQNRLKKEKQFLDQIPDSNEKQILLSNIEQVTLQKLINTKIISLTAKNLGIDISTDVAAKEILNYSFFLDQDNKFDKAKFFEILKQNNLSESKFLKLIQEETAITYTNNILAHNWLNKQNTQDNLKKYLLDKISYILYKIVDLQKHDYSFSKEEIVEYYKNNQSKFKQDEQKDIILAEINLNNIRKTIKLSDDDIKNIESQITPNNNENKDSLRQKLESDLINLKTAEIYQNILDEIEIDLKNAADIDSIIKKHKLEKKHITNINKLSNATLNDAISNIEIINEPNLIDLGNEKGSAIVEIIEVKPEHIKPIELVEVDIIEILKHEKANKELYKCAEKLKEDLLNKSNIESNNNCKFEKTDDNFIRYEFYTDKQNNFTKQIISSLMNLNIAEFTNIMTIQDNIYFAKINQIEATTNNDIVDSIIKQFIDSYNNEEEMMNYLYNLYNVKIFQ
jgi:peptidyl-prolyl cis-trans isomerase D